MQADTLAPVGLAPIKTASGAAAAPRRRAAGVPAPAGASLDAGAPGGQQQHATAGGVASDGFDSPTRASMMAAARAARRARRQGADGPVVGDALAQSEAAAAAAVTAAAAAAAASAESLAALEAEMRAVLASLARGRGENEEALLVRCARVCQAKEGGQAGRRSKGIGFKRCSGDVLSLLLSKPSHIQTPCPRLLPIAISLSPFFRRQLRREEGAASGLGSPRARGTVTAQQFQRAWRRLGLSITTAEAAALFERHGCEPGGPLRYADFAARLTAAASGGGAAEAPRGVAPSSRRLAPGPLAKSSQQQQGHGQPHQQPRGAGRVAAAPALARPPCRTRLYAPTAPDARAAARSARVPRAGLELEWVYGFAGRACLGPSAFYNAAGAAVYPVARLGVVYDAAAHAQVFFTGHDAPVRCLAMHPRRRLAATGQAPARAGGDGDGRAGGGARSDGGGRSSGGGAGVTAAAAGGLNGGGGNSSDGQRRALVCVWDSTASPPALVSRIEVPCDDADGDEGHGGRCVASRGFFARGTLCSLITLALL